MMDCMLAAATSRLAATGMRQCGHQGPNNGCYRSMAYPTVTNLRAWHRGSRIFAMCGAINFSSVGLESLVSVLGIFDKCDRIRSCSMFKDMMMMTVTVCLFNKGRCQCASAMVNLLARNLGNSVLLNFLSCHCKVFFNIIALSYVLMSHDSCLSFRFVFALQTQIPEFSRFDRIHCP
jgi:hypothetical protein